MPCPPHTSTAQPGSNSSRLCFGMLAVLFFVKKRFQLLCKILHLLRKLMMFLFLRHYHKHSYIFPLHPFLYLPILFLFYSFYCCWRRRRLYSICPHTEVKSIPLTCGIGRKNRNRLTLSHINYNTKNMKKRGRKKKRQDIDWITQEILFKK